MLSMCRCSLAIRIESRSTQRCWQEGERRFERHVAVRREGRRSLGDEQDKANVARRREQRRRTMQSSMESLRLLRLRPQRRSQSHPRHEPHEDMAILPSRPPWRVSMTLWVHWVRWEWSRPKTQASRSRHPENLPHGRRSRLQRRPDRALRFQLARVDLAWVDSTTGHPLPMEAALRLLYNHPRMGIVRAHRSHP